MLIASTNCVSTACHSIPECPLKYDNPTIIFVNGNATVFNASYADGTGVWIFIA